jgi:putative ABC transport system permease protein
MNTNTPPSFHLGRWLLSLLVSRRTNYGLFGDIEELYNKQVAEQGRWKAEIRLWGQIFRAVPHLLYNSLYWNSVMFSSYFRITVRNFKRQMLFSLINLVGLAVGMATCILIMSYVRFELGFDRFHKNAGRIYRLAINGNLSNRPFNLAVTNNPVGPVLAREYSEMEEVVRVRPHFRESVEYRDRLFFEERVFWADGSFFKVFSFPLLRGDPATALENPNSVVITRDAAERYFGRDDPLGKTLTFNRRDDYVVTGVVENIADNSHLRFDMLCSMVTFTQANRQMMERWLGDFSNYTYLLLREGTSPGTIVQKLPNLVEERMGEVLKRIGGKFKYILQPLASIHRQSRLEGELPGGGDSATVYIFSGIAAFILLLACINFINLATARSANRAREVGIRKVHGAVRKKIIQQFIGESMIYSFASLVLASTLVVVLLPIFHSISGRNVHPFQDGGPWLIPALLGLAVLVGFTAGGYPAFVLASFRPAAILKGGKHSGLGKGRLRGALVVFQFAVSLLLIIGTGVIFSQVRYMKSIRLGFDKERVVVVSIRDDSARRSIEAVKQEFLRLPGVVAAGGASHVPSWGSRFNVAQAEGFSIEDSQMTAIVHVDPDFLAALGIKVASGRGFSRSYPTDAAQSVLINETAARTFGWDNPLGKKIRELDDKSEWKTVVGVVRDYYYADARRIIEPLMIRPAVPSDIQALAVRLGPGNISSQLKALQNVWERAIHSSSFDFFFLDARLDGQYRAEERLNRLFSYFGLLAVFIACLGLFGMAAFAAEQRAKELGIRKVLGASGPEIVMMLSRDFGRLVLVANLIAWPLAYWAAGRWLRNFAYRAPVSPLLFFGSAFLVAVIAFATTSYQSVRAAAANPAEALKYE